MTITTNSQTQLSRSGYRPNKSKKTSSALLLSGIGLTAFGLSRRGWQRIAVMATGTYIAHEGINRMHGHGRVRVSYTIVREPEEVYRFARDSDNWPKFIPSLKMNADENSFILTLGRTLGREIRSHAKVTDEQEGKFIAWSSRSGKLEHRGVVHFLPAAGGRGTEVSVALEYDIPGRIFIEPLALVRGNNPEQFVRETLRSLKQIIECGEIATTLGQPVGKRGLKGAALRVLYREPQPEATSGRTETQLAGD